MGVRTIIGGGLLALLAGCSEPELLPEPAPVEIAPSRTYTPNQQFAVDVADCLRKKDYNGAQALLDTRKTDNVPSIHYLQAVTHISKCPSPRSANIKPLFDAASEFEKILDGFENGPQYINLIRNDLPSDFETIPVYQKRTAQLTEFIAKPGGGWYDIAGADTKKEILGCCNAILCLNALIFRRYFACVEQLRDAWPVLGYRASSLIKSVEKWREEENKKPKNAPGITSDADGLEQIYWQLHTLSRTPSATAELKVERPTGQQK